MPRSRSTRAHRKVLEAALKLFAHLGIDATSMDAIAAESGVSKATIYKHWRDKDALCLEALASLYGLDGPPILKTGDNRADMIAVLNRWSRAKRSGRQNRMMPHLMAYAARNPPFAKAWRARAVQPSRIQILQLLKRSIADGLLPPRLDLDAAVAMLVGPMMYRHVSSLFGRHLPENLAELVVDAFWQAHSPPIPSPPEKQAQGCSRTVPSSDPSQ
jgi:AcrR family transcriptional regulator